MCAKTEKIKTAKNARKCKIFWKSTKMPILVEEGYTNVALSVF